MKKIVLGLIILLSFVSVSYAYFTYNILSNDINVTYQPTSKSLIVVDEQSIYDYANYYYLNQGEANLSSGIATKKFTMQLSKDIQLHDDLIITSDCHIDLNNFKLDLNGHSLQVKNQFYGTVNIYNGSIIDNTSTFNIIVDTPHAYVYFPEDITPNVVNISTDAFLDSVFKYIYFYMHNYQLYNVEDLLNMQTLDTNRHCTLQHTGDNPCIYTYTDLELITNFKSYDDLKITYQSKDESILTNSGKIVSNGNVVLTVNLSYLDVVKSQDFNIHVVNSTEYAQASVLSLLEWFSLYESYDENNTFTKYVFTSSFMLPVNDNYFGGTFIYTVYDENDGVIATSETQNDYFKLSGDGNYYIVSLNKYVFKMSIQNDTYTSDKFAIEGNFQNVIVDDSAYALGVLRELYGDRIIISEDVRGYEGYTSITLLTENVSATYNRLESLDYSLINNDDGTYEISGDILRVSASRTLDPNITQNVFLQVTFTFKLEDGQLEQTVITLQVPISFETQDSGTGIDDFSPYYVYFNREFATFTNNYTYRDFSIPLSFGSRFPVYKWRIFNSANEEVTDLGLFTITILYQNRHYNMASLTYAELKAMVESGTAKTYVDIDQFKISNLDETYYFAYIPCFDVGGEIVYDNSFVSVDTYPFVSELIIPGIVRYYSEGNSYGEEAFTSSVLYKEIFELFNSNTTYVDLETFIIASQLPQHIEALDFSSRSDITSYKGINLLTGLESLNLSGVKLGSNNLMNSSNQITEITYISQMTSLRILNLTGTVISDYIGSNNTTMPYPSGSNNQFLATLSNLTSLEELYLANNEIYEFSDLTLFPNLKKVTVLGNTFTSSSSWIGGVFEAIVNAIYGTQGITNQSTFILLRGNGVELDYQDTGEENEIISALMNIEYQDYLPIGMDISYAYSNFSTSLSDYGLSATTTISTNGSNYNLHSGTLSFGYVGDATTSTQFYINLRYVYSGGIFGGGDQNIDYRVNFRITRIEV